MIDRREVLRVLAAGAAGLAVAGSASAEPKPGNTAPKKARSEEPQGDSPWWLVMPWKEGHEVGFGWTIQSMGPLWKGGAVLVLKRDDRTARVHLCARNDKMPGVARSAKLDFYVMNGGEGAAPTDEEVARALQVVALQVSKNETMPARAEDLALFETRTARVAKYGHEVMR